MDVLIIEDEALAVQKLAKLLNETDPTIQVVGVTDGIETSVEWLKHHPSPDLILMDIELSDGQSFEIFNNVDVDCPVIFTTSYDEYAIQAFKVNSLDYLLKPIRKEELQQAFRKFQRLATRNVTSVDINKLVAELQKQAQPRDFRQRFLVRRGQRLIPVETGEIICFYSEDGLSHLFTRDKLRYTVDYTLEELDQMLEPKDFFRVNRQMIIAVDAVSQIHPYFNGKLKIDLLPNPEREVLVSRDRVNDFKERMGR